MNGDYDDNFYFNNPVDYMRQPDRRLDAASAGRAATSISRPARGRGKNREEGYRLSEMLRRGAAWAHQLDDWGAGRAGHDWPYWRPALGILAGGVTRLERRPHAEAELV